MSLALGKEPDHQSLSSRNFALAGGALHEIYAGGEADGVSLCALALMLGQTRGKPVKLWVRHEAAACETGEPHAAGIAELGFDPARLLIVRARDAQAALQAGLEGVRCPALGAVIVELRGEARAYDLTASRRLSLAARTSGVPVFLLRIGAKISPGAAETRWLARAAPSRALAAKAPGAPSFHLTLLRARNGQEGLQHYLEWNRDAQRFEYPLAATEPGQDDPPDAGDRAPLSGPVVPVSFNRPRPARDESLPRRQAG